MADVDLGRSRRQATSLTLRGGTERRACSPVGMGAPDRQPEYNAPSAYRYLDIRERGGAAGARVTDNRLARGGIVDISGLVYRALYGTVGGALRRGLTACLNHEPYCCASRTRKDPRF